MPMQLPPGLAALSARLSQFGFERTRRAMAALVLSAFTTIFFLVSLNAPDGFARVFAALSICYGVAFVGVVAELFWARWFASGLAWSGIMLAIVVLTQLGWVPQFAFFGGMHLLIAVALMGKKMALRYDLQEAWRTRYKIDDYGVARLRKAITSTAASLPSMIMWLLAPREESFAVAGVAALVLAVLGLRGLVKMRSWGVLALAGAATVAGGVATASALFGAIGQGIGQGIGTTAGVSVATVPTIMSIAAAPLAVLFLAAALIPFAGPVIRFMRRPV
jgi:hypothetical protein